MSDIQHPEQWTPMEFTCKCGVKCRLDVEFVAGPGAGHLSPEHRVAALEKLCQASATTTATEDKSGSKLVAPMVQ